MEPVSLLVDVLGQVRAEPARLMAIVSESPDPLIAFDVHRVITAANAAAERYFRYEPGALTTKSVDVLVPARFRQENSPPPAVTADVTTVELQALRCDGTEVMTVWSFAAAEAEGGPIFVMVVRERSSVIADLETTTYAAVFEHAPVPIALSRNSDNAIILVNQAFADLFEVRREDVVGRPSVELGIASPEQRAEVGRILAERGAIHDLECDRRTATGKLIHVSLSVTPVRIGDVDHLMSTVRDLSQRRAQETALATARAREDYAVRLSGIGFWYCDLPFDQLAGMLASRNTSFSRPMRA